MDRFVGTHENRLDAKGRVSVPARYRELLRAGFGAELDADAPVRLMLRPARKLDCIECWPPARFERLASTLDGLDPLSDEWEVRSTIIYGRTTEAELDREGRIVVPTKLATRAKLRDRVAFLGKGDLFQLWEPEAMERHQADADARAAA